MPLVKIDIIIPESPVLVGRISDENTVLTKGVNEIAGRDVLPYKIKQGKAAAEYEEERGNENSREPARDSEGKLREHDQEPEKAENRGQIICDFNREAHALQVSA